MEKISTYKVRGLAEGDRAAQVANTLHSRRGVLDVDTDAATGTVRLRYDSVMVPPPRVLDYLRSAGVEPLEEIRVQDRPAPEEDP
jgi:hypothetical protein